MLRLTLSPIMFLANVIMESSRHRRHVVRFANPVFTVVNMSNSPSLSPKSIGKDFL
jgi:hypothetical protein